MRVEKNAYRTPRYVFTWLERRFAWFHLGGFVKECGIS